MTPLQSWLRRPLTTVRIDRTVPWTNWREMLRRPFGGGKSDLGPRIEVLDRLALGGKKSLLLIAIENRRLLVGVGEDAAPSIVQFETRRGSPLPNLSARDKAAALRRMRVRG